MSQNRTRSIKRTNKKKINKNSPPKKKKEKKFEWEKEKVKVKRNKKKERERGLKRRKEEGKNTGAEVKTGNVVNIVQHLLPRRLLRKIPLVS